MPPIYSSPYLTRFILVCLKAATTEDTLKVMEAVAKLGHKNRAERLLKEKELKFGFNKDADS